MVHVAPQQPPAGAMHWLPRAVALRDTLLFLWCGRLVRLARTRKLESGDAGAVLPRGVQDDIDKQVRKAW